MISGDFGFVTGDGSYHQAKYATDENGKFRLLSAKSSYRRVKGNDLKRKTSEVLEPPKAVALASCSSCKIIEKMTEVVHEDAVKKISAARAEQSPRKPLVQEKVAEAPKVVTEPPTAAPPTTKAPTTAAPTTAALTTVAPTTAAPTTKAPTTSAPTTKAPTTEAPTTEATPPKPQTERPYDVVSTVSGDKKSSIADFTNSKAPSKPLPTSNTPTVSETAPPAPPASSLQAKPVLAINAPGPKVTGAYKPPVAAMPALLKAMNSFLSDLVYRFNYTTTYHGHNEEGSRNGNKKGGYFSVGRDNVRRTVEYIANENGFQPHVKYELVNPAEAPNEVNDKNGILKGFEFKWFKVAP